MAAAKKLGQRDLAHFMMKEVVDEWKRKLKEKEQQFSATCLDIKYFKRKDLTCTLGMKMYHGIVLSSVISSSLALRGDIVFLELRCFVQARHFGLRGPAQTFIAPQCVRQQHS